MSENSCVANFDTFGKIGLSVAAQGSTPALTSVMPVEEDEGLVDGGDWGDLV